MDPFAVLGVSPEASVEEIRWAWKSLARSCHPDAGGSVQQMQQLNEALRSALSTCRARTEQGMTSGAASSFTSSMSTAVTDEQAQATGSTRRSTTRDREHLRSRISRDISSFTVDCLPVETFEALLVAVSWHGEIAVEECPYLLEVVLSDPWQCWVRFEIFPEAGASTVSVSVAVPESSPPVSSEDIRDVFVASLNELDWNQLQP